MLSKKRAPLSVDQLLPPLKKAKLHYNSQEHSYADVDPITQDFLNYFENIFQNEISNNQNGYFDASLSPTVDLETPTNPFKVNPIYFD